MKGKLNGDIEPYTNQKLENLSSNNTKSLTTLPPASNNLSFDSRKGVKTSENKRRNIKHQPNKSNRRWGNNSNESSLDKSKKSQVDPKQRLSYSQISQLNNISEGDSTKSKKEVLKSEHV